MVVRIILGLVLIGMGAFALYTVLTKPHHDWSNNPFDQAMGIPKIVTKVLRGGVGLLFVSLGIIAILKTVGLL